MKMLDEYFFNHLANGKSVKAKPAATDRYCPSGAIR